MAFVLFLLLEMLFPQMSALPPSHFLLVSNVTFLVRSSLAPYLKWQHPFPSIS